MADRAVERDRACEKVYRASSVSSENNAGGSDWGNDCSSLSGEVLPKMIRSPCNRVFLGTQG